MDNANLSDRLRDLYLTGVRPNGKDIGIGAYGRVFEVEYCGTVFAAKEVHSILVQGVRRQEFEATKKSFLTECIRSGSLSHPNIVLFLGVYNPGGQSQLPVLVMERMQESLTSVVEKYPNIPMYVKLSVLLDVSRGLWYLHTHYPPIVHRDLSPNNILLTSQFIAKISDLGVAKAIQADSRNTKTRAPGTVDFMPPEALLEIPEYGPSLDVFSYGGVILHVVNQEWPNPLHYVMTDPKTGKLVGLSEVQRRHQHIEKLTTTLADLKPLVEKCLHNHPSRRLPISDVSERLKKIKENERTRFPHVNQSPITWLQEDHMLRQTTTRSPTAKVQLENFNKRSANNICLQQPVDICKKTVKWEEVASLPVARRAHTAVLLGGNIYVGGGYEGISINDEKFSYRLDIYNLATNQWSPSPITTPYDSYALTILDDKLVTVGGATKNKKVVKKVLLLKAGRWKVYSEMPTARCFATAVGYHSMLIVVGGTVDVKMEGGISTTELLDATNGCWYTCSNLPSQHQQMKPVILNDKLYLLGGIDKDTRRSPQVFVASLHTLSSHQLNWQSSPITPCCRSAPVALYKFLLTVGGVQQRCSSEVNVFNPSADQWKHLTNIPAARSGSAVVGVADSIIVVGGAPNNDQNSSIVWVGTFE